jgi:phage shock protein C
MNRIYRSETDKYLAGICGGLAEMYTWDPTVIRLILIFLTLVTAALPVIVTYIIGWIVIPKKSDLPAS